MADGRVRLLWLFADNACFAREWDLYTTRALVKAFERTGKIDQYITYLSGLTLAGSDLYVSTTKYGRGVLDTRPAPLSMRYRIGYFDAVWLRVDPPITEQFRHALIMLAMQEQERNVLVINSARDICVRGSKLLTQFLSDHSPESLVSGDSRELLRFTQRVNGQACVAKPLDEISGRDVIKIDSPAEARTLLDGLLRKHRFLMVQRFVPEILTEGEIRCLVFDGELVCAWRKVPAGGEFLANRDCGASIEAIVEGELPARLTSVVDRLRRVVPGVVFYSADFVGGRLIEINHENVGGLPDADQLYRQDHGGRIAGSFLAMLERDRSER